MKTIFKSLMMFAAAALTLAGCEKETVSENAAPEVSGEKITVKAAVKNAATRVSVSDADGDYSAVWDDDDAIDIVEFAGKSGSITENTAYQLVAAENIEVADELAMFEFELDKTEGEGFTYYAVYPGGNDDSFVAKKYQELVLPMPAVQKPTAASLIDPKANVVIAKAETDAQTSELLFEDVINAASYARMTIKGLPDDVTPKTVKFENKTISGGYGVNIAGCYWYMVNDGSFAAAYGSGAPNATTAITVDQSEAQDANVVWFGLAPVGKITDFIVTVTGSDDKEYVKTVTGAETLNFTAGKIINFSVTVENAEDDPNLVYYNDFDVEKVSSNTTIGQNTAQYKNEKGSGASTVTYSFNNMSIRTSFNTSESGNNIIFFGAVGNYFTIENITVPTRNLNLQFGVSKVASNSLTSINTSEFTVKFSENGVDWSSPVPYTAPTNTSWVTASIDFTLPESTTNLYIKFEASVASVYRLDDVKLVGGEGGQDITFGGTTDPNPDTDPSFTIQSSEVVSNSAYTSYTKTVNDRGWVITYGGNNYSVGTNKNNRSNCTLNSDSYKKYAVSPAATTSSIASAFANTTAISNVSKIEYTFNGGSNQTSTKVYLLYSADNETFSQMELTAGTQGAAIAANTAFKFERCSGYFAVLFVATNTSDAWRIDNVDLTFTYTE